MASYLTILGGSPIGLPEVSVKLYTNPGSTNARRARLTAAVLGIDLEEVLVDLGKGEHKRPEYLALNPNGAVPTLVDGDFVLTESRVIMQYLASKRPESGLFPQDEPTRFQVTRWQFWDAAHFSPAVGTVFFEKILKRLFGLGEPDAGRIADGLANHRRFMGVLDGHLTNRTYVVGEALTLADITLATSLTYEKVLELPIADFQNVRDWFARVTAQDLGEAWARTDPAR
jgi:glutathione S-transferase